MAVDWSDSTWYKDVIIYQLHVKAFFDANNDGIGDFPGLLEKLDYIQDLGVTAIWLLPFYPSPLRDDGYDIADYEAVNPAYGTMKDFRRFVREAHRRGIRVITELVINHTSDQHAWFQRARMAKPGTSARDFYVWSDTDKKYQGTRIIFLDTETSNWTWDPVAQAYFWHRFYSHQPDLNFENPRVLKEVVRVMHFWLEMGVDGMRLDAVPYLREREGTNNENLPETHEVLKAIRAEVDAHFPGRMLLAEANQWPEDTRPYFGDGDECHMAFHFPLMPRMYMALAQEDRHPITDIIDQTPEIPDNAQWAIFLRNHDELTLEMVTDRERDYLWNYYAEERRGRINLGIRRRLSTLMDNDRRKIELMNALLFSMPGTPVIYYGDEIGMGDNFFLGDRDGVRTPMQWSSDRNGGFSRADPQRLYLPPIMDPVYGYAVVNVEAQQANRSSLLNWMKRIIAVRKQHTAFGRGTMTFLFPRNRKVLAYLRQYEEETILCVANLSRAAQAVELDLSAFKGAVPIEMLGRSPFPPIGDLPYLLTLPAYGFYWFNITKQADLPAWHTPMPEPVPEFTTIVIRNLETDITGFKARILLEKKALPAFLPNQRWFAEKGAAQPEVTIASTTLVEGAEGQHLFVQLDVRPDPAASPQRYLLPMTVAWGEQHISPGAPLLSYTIAKVRSGPSLGALFDSSQSDDFIRMVVAAMREQRRVSSEGGEIRFSSTEQLRRLDIAETPEIRRLGAEQSNTSVLLDSKVMLKLYRKLQEGVQPEIEVGRFLTEVARFANTPAYLGAIEFADGEGRTTVLGAAYAFVRNQGDGWEATIEWLKRFIDDEAMSLSARGISINEETIAGALAPYLDRARTLGRRTGSLHLAFASPTDDPAFAPEPITPADLQAWAQAVHEQHARSRAALENLPAGLPEKLHASARKMLAAGDLISRRIDDLAARPVNGLKTRVHGDYHLGQVLVAQNEFYIIDFEGEPARGVEARRRKTSPLKDVAGMVRSFDYAAFTAIRWAEDEPVTDEAAVTAVRHWNRQTTAAFLDAYKQTIRGASDGPGIELSEATFDSLLELFLLEKALYEIAYEASNRPKWVDIPLTGLMRLLTPEATDGSSAGKDAENA
ncbi:maltose alpha-D-glucosyltransferase [Rhodoligotrophos defluvii]|uniref:maltose alpha-D-glucosyltransferase n=1 Tax=Rhodoligotrophos defluvii TaxID=2561934 RepID=UPI0010C9E1E8|nr:maltose alpha-D-glucosyltransferase [Rhodoligotrophos defluvii]